MNKDKVTYVFLKHLNVEIPAIKIVDSVLKKDVKICFRDKKDFHCSLHLTESNQILRTIYDEEKITGCWDEERFGVAKSLGLKKPERHGKYIDQQILSFKDQEGYHLIGHRFDMGSVLKKPSNFSKLNSVYFSVLSSHPMISLYLAGVISKAEYVETSLGFIVFVEDR